ncbi:MAG: penicillin-binding protein 2 [Bacteroidales bacterium]|nr:penicillin-binding protein 2 [Bacteroidales bacterium]
MELDRKNKLLIGLGVAVLLLLGKIFYIQVIDRSYKENALNNSMVYDDIFPPRGLILDRNGKVLVNNQVCYDILVTPRELAPFDTLTLCDLLGITPEYVKEKTDYYRRYRTRIGYQTVTFLKQVSTETYSRFSEQAYRFPGFSGKERTIRSYPINAGGNLLGYISEADPVFLNTHKDYKPGDLVGKTGIEAAMESELKGKKGYHIFLRNSRNQIKATYNNGESDVSAEPGTDMVTTIDADLQQYGQYLMSGKLGSIVAIEPGTGEILAMVSSPGIDVSDLADIGKNYNKISRDRNKPMFNRTVQASYPPGSVFKLVNGLIGLQEGTLTPDRRYPCNNGFVYTSGGKKLGCHSHRSPLNLEEAVMMSCNGYFCYVFREILSNPAFKSREEAFDAWRDYVTSFGFGGSLGSDFPFELGGNIPTSNYYNRIYGKNGWRFQTIISLSIGQGEIGVTPLQIANLSATVANRGHYFIPHIIKDTDGFEIDLKFKEPKYTKVDSVQFEKVIGGMWRAVNSGPGSGGTASVAAVPGLDICGKTGTAQNPHGADHSVFICFAPRENPKIAVAVYVENAGFGATWACPIASLILEKYLTGSVREERKWLEERVVNKRFI